MSDYFNDVKDFHKAFGLKIGPTQQPGFSDPASRELRLKLLDEEYTEYLEGEYADDFVNVAKELTDIIYIVCGTAVEYGIPLNEVFQAVHESNMAKLVDGKPIYREDGKVAKPLDWKKPDIAAILKPVIDASHYMTETQWDGIQIGDAVNHVMYPWTAFIVVGSSALGGWDVMRADHNGDADHRRMSTRKEWFLQSRVTGRVSQ